MSILRINEFQAEIGKAGELLAVLESLLPSIANAEGCLSCELFEDTESQGVTLIVERWESVEAHEKAVEQIPQEKVRAVMELVGPNVRSNYFKSVSKGETGT